MQLFWPLARGAQKRGQSTWRHSTQPGREIVRPSGHELRVFPTVTTQMDLRARAPTPHPTPSSQPICRNPGPRARSTPRSSSEFTVWHPPQLFWDHLGVTEAPGQKPLWKFLRSHPSRQPQILTLHVEAPSTLPLRVYLFSQKSGTVPFSVPTGLLRY